MPFVVFAAGAASFAGVLIKRIGALTHHRRKSPILNPADAQERFAVAERFYRKAVPDNRGWVPSYHLLTTVSYANSAIFSRL